MRKTSSNASVAPKSPSTQNKILERRRRRKELALYLFFGVCTTAVNTICYAVLYEISDVGNVAATIISWVVAVVFAFVTNRRYVFESRKTKISERFGELINFTGCRFATGVLDVAIMFVAVDKLGWNGTFWKLVSNVVVTVLNYVASKYWIFQPSQTNNNRADRH